jgi:hypothetical protein
MTKEFKTRGELLKLVLDEACRSGKCADLPDIVITGPSQVVNLRGISGSNPEAWLYPSIAPQRLIKSCEACR